MQKIFNKINFNYILHIILFFIIFCYSVSIGYIYNSKISAFISVLVLIVISLIISIKSKNTDSIETSKKNIIALKVLAIFLSLFLIYSFNIYKHSFQPNVDINIVANHEKNKYSNGYDVEILNIKLDNKIIPFSEMQISGNYRIDNPEHREKYLTLIPEEGRFSSIKIRGKCNNVYFAIAANQDGGIADLNINDKKYNIDTFITDVSQEFGYFQGIKLMTFYVDNNLSILQKTYKFIYILAYFILFYIILFNLGHIILNTNIYIKKTDKRNGGSFFIYSIPILISCTIFLFAFYPAIMSFDSLTQWKFASFGNYGIEHSVLHTYLIHLLQRIYKSPVMVVILHILIISFLVGYFFSKYEKYNIPRYYLIICSLLIAITPYNGLMSVSLWKDVLYSYAVFALVLAAILLCFQKEEFFKSKTNISIMLIAMILATFVRYNGLVIIPLYLFFIFLLLKKIRKKIVILSVVFLVFSLIVFWKVSSLPIEDRAYVHNQVVEVPIYLIQSVIAHDGKISSKNLDELDNIVPIYRWKYGFTKYLPHNFIFATPELRDNRISRKKVMKIYFSLLKDNFILMSKEILHINSYVLKYGANQEGVSIMQQLVFDIQNDNALSIKYNVSDYSLNQTSFLPKFNNFIKKLNEKFLNILFKPFPYVFIFIMFSALFIVKNGIKYSFVILPVILSILSFSISLPEMSSRYVFSLFLLFPVIILLSLTKETE